MSISVDQKGLAINGYRLTNTETGKERIVYGSWKIQATVAEMEGRGRSVLLDYPISR